ncbi:LytTR family DNA-binding domain-containing protein [Roseovarius sp. MMSF_3359]|uniref:LytTR family DNA-binding domain-containing protein n=2 Tax=unclassified Roseovarius TaxID=2614913 RepID=UPI00273EDC93|nr:LytTR family DNA-binding domain-containing protein [Roseovarius sp. MMSF_3359]
MPLSSRIEVSFREVFRTVFSRLTLFFWITAILGGVIAGPFDTYGNMTWPGRAAYWTLVVSLAVVFGYALRAVSLALIGTKRQVLLDLVTVALVTLCFAPVVWVITRALSPSAVLGMQPMLTFAGYVMMCTATVVIGRRLVPRAGVRAIDPLAEPAPAEKPPEQPLPAPRLLRRLAPEMQGDILRLSANDHVVDVVTSHGTTTLRMRLVDAIAEMEPVEGYCVHRSHWVAHGAIERVVRQNSSKLFVVLSNEDRIPVSRKYRVNLEEAGMV